jgi:SAM-dependent methyltransferase
MEVPKLCRICHSQADHRLYEVREMQFGTRELFKYLECAACKCLQLVDVPADLSRYYPATYESLNQQPSDYFRGAIKNKLKAFKTRFAVSGRGPLRRSLDAVRPKSDPGIKALSLIKPSRHARILDVGCGTGHRLYELKNAGFHHVSGIDPFIRSDIHYPNGLTVKKQTLEEVAGEWDIIMFHHSFEHLIDPRAALKLASKLLATRGTCLIRVPTTSSWAWETYRENWAQIDAPRHIIIPSEQGLALLASYAGFNVARVEFDSTEFQFLASMFYRDDIAWNEARNRPDLQPMFGTKAISTLKQDAEKLNRQRRGDQLVCIMRKV